MWPRKLKAPTLDRRGFWCAHINHSIQPVSRPILCAYIPASTDGRVNPRGKHVQLTRPIYQLHTLQSNAVLHSAIPFLVLWLRKILRRAQNSALHIPKPLKLWLGKIQSILKQPISANLMSWGWVLDLLLEISSHWIAMQLFGPLHQLNETYHFVAFSEGLSEYFHRSTFRSMIVWNNWHNFTRCETQFL